MKSQPARLPFLLLSRLPSSLRERTAIRSFHGPPTTFWSRSITHTHTSSAFQQTLRRQTHLPSVKNGVLHPAWMSSHTHGPGGGHGLRRLHAAGRGRHGLRRVKAHSASHQLQAGGSLRSLMGDTQRPRVWQRLTPPAHREHGFHPGPSPSPLEMCKTKTTHLCQTKPSHHACPLGPQCQKADSERQVGTQGRTTASWA